MIYFIVGHRNPRDKMNKIKAQTWTSAGKDTTSKYGKILYFVMKKSASVMTRLLVISQSACDIDLI